MIKIILIFFSLTLYATTINTKIVKTKKNIGFTKNRISNMNATLDKLVKQINQKKDILNNINYKINRLNKKINLLKNNLKNKNKKLKNLQLQKSELEEQKNILQKEIISFISENYTAQTQEISSINDLINNEILISLSKMSSKKMDYIASLYSKIDAKIAKITKTIDEIKNSAFILKNKKRELAKLKEQQNNKIKLLNVRKLAYKRKLQNLLYEQRKMQNRLSNLNIIQKEKAKKARELAKRRAEIEYKKRKIAEAKNNINTTSHYNKAADKIKVKEYGNVYMKTKTTRYRGAKTIPPVKYFTIIKKFGAYIDPIYHISLYNDSITLKTRPNTRVHAILAGKVVFVNNQNNNKMIVIEHKNHLHSIYAKLSKISPFIKKGYKVKKNEVIAKEDGKLEFEVTYKTYPINPLQIINLR